MYVQRVLTSHLQAMPQPHTSDFNNLNHGTLHVINKKNPKAKLSKSYYKSIYTLLTWGKRIGNYQKKIPRNLCKLDSWPCCDF